MRTYDEVKTLYKYANECTDKVSWYNDVINNRTVDKKQKSIIVTAKFDWYTGYDGSSLIYQVMQYNKVMDSAISDFLTQNFDEVMEHCSNYIKNSLKNDMESIKKEEYEKLLLDISI